MKVKTSELNEIPLDWAVARCEGYHGSINLHAFGLGKHEVVYVNGETGEWHHNGNWQPSTNWQQGGPIIEREFICVNGDSGAPNTAPSWDASIFDDGEHRQSGPTPLIAAMRCLVAMNFGEAVDIPDELCQLQNN